MLFKSITYLEVSSFIKSIPQLLESIFKANYIQTMMIPNNNFSSNKLTQYMHKMPENRKTLCGIFHLLFTTRAPTMT